MLSCDAGLCNVRGICRRQLLAALFDRGHDPKLVLRVDLVAQRAGERVSCPLNRCRPPIGSGDDPATLIRRLLQGVGDDLIDLRSGDEKGLAYHQTVLSRFSISSTGVV